MRHRKNFNHLSRKVGHRKAMFANMASSLIIHKRIETTTAKAKALRSYVEPLITKSKDDSTHSRRIVFSYLNDKEAVSELFREVSPKIMERPGGYTRILKIGKRLGDNADMSIIELVDYNENLLSAKDDKAASGKRRRRGSKKKADDTVVATESTVEQKVDIAEQAEDKVKELKQETTEEPIVEAAVEEKAVQEEPVAEAIVEEKVEEEPIVEAVVEENIVEASDEKEIEETEESTDKEDLEEQK